MMRGMLSIEPNTSPSYSRRSLITFIHEVRLRSVGKLHFIQNSGMRS